MTRKDVHLYMVAYDVPNDRRRTRVATVLQGFGTRVQYSVFLVEVAGVKRARLQRALMDAMDPVEDSVIIGDLGPFERIESVLVTLGRSRPLLDPKSFIL